MKMRLAVVFNRLGPYHVARLAEAASRGPVVAIEAYREDRIYQWEHVDHDGAFERVTVMNRQPRRGGRGAVRRELHSQLGNLQPDVVAVPGWGSSVALSALEWALTHRCPVVAMSDSTPWDAGRTWLKESVKRRLVRCFGGALVGGRPHADYLVSLGMPSHLIFQGYDVVDNQHFAEGARRVRGRASYHRAQLGLPEKFFLASARFIARKNLPRLVEAFAEYRKLVDREAWSLVVLGDGPGRAELVASIEKAGMREAVQLRGFEQYSTLPAYYGLASAFVHPPVVEQWGLVVNEAMAAGLPVIVSERCGCARDLVRHGVNGFLFDPTNVSQLAQRMATIASDADLAAAMGVRSSRLIQGWSPTAFADGLWAAAAVARRRPVPTGRGLARILLILLARAVE